MKLGIVASQPLKKQTLEVHDTGISYNESGGFGMGEWTHHEFREIDAVMRSTSEPVLSIHVGPTVYRIRFNDKDQDHQSVIALIVAGAKKSQEGAG